MGDDESKKGPPIAALVVLGVVAFCCLTGLGGAAIGYSSFQEYLARSKASEASANLAMLFQASAAYYATEPYGAGSVHGGGAPAPTGCTVDPAITSNVPGEQKTMIDWASEPESFREIGFAVADPVYYQYEIAGGPGGCSSPANAPVYSLRAHGDLDGDGERSLFELTVRSDALNQLERGGPVRMENELE